MSLLVGLMIWCEAFAASTRGEVWPYILAATMFLSPLASLAAYLGGSWLRNVLKHTSAKSSSPLVYRTATLYLLVGIFALYCTATNVYGNFLDQLSLVAMWALVPSAAAHYLLWRLCNYKLPVTCPTEIEKEPEAPLPEISHDGEDWTAS